MTEKQLRPIVEVWMSRNGYYVAHECLIGGYCDMIGCRWSERISRARPELSETMAVELKIKDIKGVISQAKGNHYHCTYSYAAMPYDFCLKMQLKSIDEFKQAGVGLLGVGPMAVTYLIASERKDRKHSDPIKNRLWRYYLRHKRSSSPESLT